MPQQQYGNCRLSRKPVHEREVCALRRPNDRRNGADRADRKRARAVGVKCGSLFVLVGVSVMVWGCMRLVAARELNAGSMRAFAGEREVQVEKLVAPHADWDGTISHGSIATRGGFPQPSECVVKGNTRRKRFVPLLMFRSTSHQHARHVGELLPGQC